MLKGSGSPGFPKRPIGPSECLCIAMLFLSLREFLAFRSSIPFGDINSLTFELFPVYIEVCCLSFAFIGHVNKMILDISANASRGGSKNTPKGRSNLAAKHSSKTSENVYHWKNNDGSHKGIKVTSCWDVLKYKPVTENIL